MPLAVLRCVLHKLGILARCDLVPWARYVRHCPCLPDGGYLTSFYSGNVSAERLNAMLIFVVSQRGRCT